MDHCYFYCNAGQTKQWRPWQMKLNLANGVAVLCMMLLLGINGCILMSMTELSGAFNFAK